MDRLEKMKSAAERNIAEGQILFGECYRHGGSVTRREMEAKDWLRRYVLRECADAQLRHIEFDYMGEVASESL
jgi:TPR repeat protein